MREATEALWRSQSGGIKQLLKRNIFKCFLKVCSELQFKTSPGRLFQMKGAEYEYERLANSVFVLGIVSIVEAPWIVFDV